MKRVFRINDKESLRLAYEILDMVKKLDKENKNAEYIKQLKSDIREYLRFDNEEPDYVHYDDYGSFTIRVEVPDYCKTDEDIEEWFDLCQRRTAMPSQYDCTGQLFTISYKVITLHGQRYLYHYIGMDV